VTSTRWLSSTAEDRRSRVRRKRGGDTALEYGRRLAAAADAKLRVISGLEPSAQPRSARTVDGEVEVLNGRPAEALAQASHALDLLVVGSRRRGAVRRALLGSVSSPLVGRAKCPVVIAPGGAA